MNEIKCPKCSEVFTVDESGYIAILGQVRDAEFQKELSQREKLIGDAKEKELELIKAEADHTLKNSLVESQKEIERLKMLVDAEKKEKESELEIAQANAKLKLETKLAESNQEIERLKLLVEASNKDKKSELEVADANAKAILEKSLSESNREIEKLKGELKKAETEKILAVSEESAKGKSELADKEQQIIKLRLEAESSESANELKIKVLEESYKGKLTEKDEQINFYKDLKAKQSTKMLGETLEQHCEIAFNQIRPAGFQNAYFEKDNDARSGSKGDYIFREKTETDIEFISIMFEMKNEMDTTATKKKNEDFLKELDKDRREKNCEYAVLVSLLEADNDYYNSGIVDVSHRYPKMYIIRPQFFIPMITLLRNAAKNSARYREELAEVQNQNIDISNFEQQMLSFKDSFGKNVQWASERFTDAIKNIDDTIKLLQRMRDNLTLSEKHLNTANSKAQDLSIKKLTKSNPTMTAKFAQLHSDKPE